MTRVFLIAASPVILAGLDSLLARSGAVTIVGSSARVSSLAEEMDGAEAEIIVLALDRASELTLPIPVWPDSAHRAPGLVVLCDVPDNDTIADLLRGGVKAVLPRASAPGELLAAVEAAKAGLVVVPADIAAALLSSGTPRRLARLAGKSTMTPLSPRESEVLGLLAEGMGNKIVAARLGISEHTVKTHVASLFQKLGADTRTEAVAIGARMGVILL